MMILILIVAFKDGGIKTLLFDDKGKYLDIVDRVGSLERSRRYFIYQLKY